MSTITSLSSRKRRHEDIVDASSRLATPLISDTETITGSQRSSPLEKRTLKNKRQKAPAFIVGIDFGTTTTSISYHKLNSNENFTTIPPEQIKFIKRWKGSGRDADRGEVPSESVYLNGKFYWGYKAQTELQTFIQDGNELDGTMNILRFTKIIFENDQAMDPTAQETRIAERDSRIRTVRKTLIALGKSIRDVVKDFMVAVLKHTKQQMVTHENLRDSDEVEFSMAIPAGWPIEASWEFQKIIQAAAEEISFGKIFDLFIINEPEASSAFALESMISISDLGEGEAFMVCDAGGGTVDITTYTVSHRSPLRLTEAVAPSGSNCGSTWVNQAMERHMRSLLEEEILSSDTERKAAIAYQLERVFRDFEFSVKRDFDSREDMNGVHPFLFVGLKPNKALGIDGLNIKVARKDISKWFEESLEQIWSLIEKQIEVCEEQRLNIQRIFFFGGYSNSGTFQSFLEKRLQHRCELLYPQKSHSESMVSRGAVLRALNKSQGPARKALANVGVLQTEPLDRGHPGHRDCKLVIDPHDMKRYVPNTMQWLVKKGETTKFVERWDERNHRTFGARERWIIKQDLYYNTTLSDVKDHYPEDHEENQGSMYLHRIEVDLTHLKGKYGVKLQRNKDGKSYYSIKYKLQMEMQGRNLTVAIRYPPSGVIRKSMRVLLAASFTPGTD